MADVAVLAQSPLAEQPDDNAHQVSQTLLQAFQTAKFLLVTLFDPMQYLHSNRQVAAAVYASSDIRLKLLVLIQLRGN